MDSIGIGIGLAIGAWWILQTSGLPGPVDEFIKAGKSIVEFRAALQRVEDNTAQVSEQVHGLSLDIEEYKDRHARQHRQINRDLLNRGGTD